MPTRTDIINMAVANLGDEPVADVSVNRKSLNLARIHYDTALMAVLRDHAWGFANRFAAAAKLNGTPARGGHAYAYPSDCARVLRLHGPAGAVGFEIGRSPDGRHRAILSDSGPPLTVEYTSMNVEPDEYDAKFTAALAWRITAAIALGVTNSGELHQSAMQTCMMLIEDAKLSDAREGLPPGFPEGEILASRRY